MKHLFAAALAALLSVAAASAQSAREQILANKYLAGSNYLDYDRLFPNKPLTPAPKGYEPFYLSHYGRHGSRWLLGDNEYTDPLKTLRKAQALGVLTADGQKTLDDLERFYPTTLRRLGDLTPRGERQHHGIARRMAQRFPEIFLSKHVAIDARSTVVQRCILSMTAACIELAAANPTVRIHNDVSESLQHYLNQNWSGEVRRQGGKGRDIRNHYQQQYTHPERFCAQLFTDPTFIADSIDAGHFMRRMFDVATNMQSHDTDIDFLHLFTPEECYDQWRIRNIDWYIGYGASPVTASVMPFSQRNLLRNIIETADTVTQTQATLRFGHEVCVMPLACLLELDSCGAVVDDLDRLDERWVNYRIYPMGCNIQLIFYRPKKGRSGDVLVKALLNENEATLPVATDSFPYYRWQDVRQYYIDKLDAFDAEYGRN